MPSGAGFAAMEGPKLLARDIVRFFATRHQERARVAAGHGCRTATANTPFVWRLCPHHMRGISYPGKLFCNRSCMELFQGRGGVSRVGCVTIRIQPDLVSVGPVNAKSRVKEG